ncbi:hypothetical protein OSB04_001716 [Centaurea solstitialis]|uniref:non-specific serine/threonine protein kinase n=1 Tax=Centaurea solstitialis TaxID=347529 RepID=A0AA38U381_9ASTR|nr:hypothetical protein OSB04_001716 [Centaurea solstitialis]
MGFKRFDYEDIKQATNNFAEDNIIGIGSSGKVYQGKLLRPEGLVTYAFKRIESHGRSGNLKLYMYLSKIKHENICSFVGICMDTPTTEVLVFEFPSRRSLDLYLSTAELTWLKRLKICLGVARGLSYLHGDKGIVHHNVKITNILLDDNWQAKINFGNADWEEYTTLHNPIGTIDNIDPWYFESGFLTKESDIYSLGMVLFEVLCRKPTSTTSDDSVIVEPLSKLARQHYENGTLTEIIDPILRKQMSPNSFDIFSAISYRCRQWDREKRPKILEIVKKIEEALGHQLEFEKVSAVELKRSFQQHLKIPLKEIHFATNGFHANHLIGWGGFGGVYKAELLHLDVRKYVKMDDFHRQSIVENSTYPRRKSKVAVKKLDSRYGQGRKQFLQEIDVLSLLNHQNIVPLLGFCDEDGEMILVYEYASNGSLDRHIGKFGKVYSHTWAQRLQICLDMAHGLNYLHEMDIIHRDIKSANILIGHAQEVMIGDFGLSRTKKNPDVEYSITDVAGTAAYVEPKYARTGMLTKQTDIYSLGVVLLEVFCGRLVVSPTLGDDPEYLLHEAKRHFQQKTFNQMIDPYLNEEFEKSCAISGNTSFSDSINTFVEITYKCLHDDQAHHLTMKDVVKELKKASTIFHGEGMEMLSTEPTKLDTNNFTED